MTTRRDEPTSTSRTSTPPATPEAFAAVWPTLFQHEWSGSETELTNLKRYPVYTLSDALLIRWPTDAEMWPGQAVDVKTGEVQNPVPCLKKACLAGLAEMGLKIVFAAIVIDLDDPVAHKNSTSATEDWVAATMEKFTKLPWFATMAWYRTRAGFRALWLLPTAMDIDTFKAFGTHFRAELRVRGLDPDELTDWTRCFRLPFVVRDGVPQELDHDFERLGVLGWSLEAGGPDGAASAARGRHRTGGGKAHKTPEPTTVPARCERTWIPGSTIVQAKDGTELALDAWGPRIKEKEKVACHCPVHNDASPSAVLLKYKRSSVAFVYCSACCRTYWPDRCDPAAESRGLASLPSAGSEAGRYVTLSREDFGPGLHVVKADTGTGKTTALAKLLTDARSHGERVLVVVHRRVLAREAARVYELGCYLDPHLPYEIEIQPFGGLVISLDSLLKYVWSGLDAQHRHLGPIADWIVLEESESAIAHIDGGTIKKVRAGRSPTARDIYFRAETIILACLAARGRVIAVDALAGDLTTTTLARWAGVAPDVVRSHSHTWTGGDPTIIMYNRDSEMAAQLLVTLRAGRRCAVACTSAMAARRLHTWLATEGHPGLLITSEEVRHHVADVTITAGWGAEQLVIYSPAIDSGVSFDPADPAERFSDVFLFFTSVEGVGWRTLVQMRHRMRNHRTVHAWIAPQAVHYKSCEAADQRSHIRTRWKSTKARLLQHIQDRGRLEAACPFDDDHYTETITQIRVAGLLATADVSASWLRYWRSRGATPTEAPAVDPAALAIRNRGWPGACALVDTTYDALVEGAPRLDSANAAAIKKKGARSSEEARALERVRLIDQFGEIRPGMPTLDRHRRRTETVARSTRAALVAEGPAGQRAEVCLGDDLEALREGDTTAVKGESVKIQMAVDLLTCVIDPEWLRRMLPPHVLIDGEFSNAVPTLMPVGSRARLHAQVAARPPLPAPDEATWTAKDIDFTEAWRRISESLEGAEVFLCEIGGLTPFALERNPARAMGVLLQHLGLGTVRRRVGPRGNRVSVYRVNPNKWKRTRADMERTARRAMGEEVPEWHTLPDAGE